MRRGFLLAGALALLLTLALWVAAKVERSPLVRAHHAAHTPEVVAGRDLGSAASDAAPLREEADDAFVRCGYVGEGAQGKLVAMGDSAVQGDGLSLRLAPGRWTIAWYADDRMIPLGAVELEAGDVATCRLTDGGWEVRGSVRNLHGQALADVAVLACGKRTETDESGRFTAASTRASCSVRALVRDGLLSRPSDEVQVGPFDAGGVTLEVDDAPIAGMGLAFRMREDGARITYVHPGTPAERAGLQEGDLILEVDGTSTADLTNDQFVALGTGREGSEVTLVFERDGLERHARFRRERLEREDTGE